MYREEPTHPQPAVLDAEELARREYSEAVKPVILKHGDIPPKSHPDYVKIVKPAWRAYQLAIGAPVED